MKEEIAKAFDSKQNEENIYKLWEESSLFSPEKFEQCLKEKNRKAGKPFVSTLPPPNANGDPHLGHMCGYAFHDLLGRYWRLSNRPTLLLPGKDHASIQTEAVFVRELEKNGESKWELGRDEFFKRCYEFCMMNANNARSQEKRIGLSADWNRELFTLDPKLEKTIYDTFYKLFADGLVYRGKRIINQCPNCKTALADVDTEHEEKSGIFAYITYPFADPKDEAIAKKDFTGKKIGEKDYPTNGITVATTRPETMLGDTAVAVNPADSRYKRLIGHKVILPFMEKEIPIIAEKDVDMELGTGALKVTPAHSPIDFEIGKRHNLDIVNVIGPDATMTSPAPKEYIGMGTVECSKALVAKLDKKGLLVSIERIKHEVVICERCHTNIEPIISHQWFINTKPLAEKAIASLESGETKVIPHGSQIALKKFFENIEPWCISRQLWWCQRFPIWYSGGKELYDWLSDNPEKTVGDYEKETGKKAQGSGKIITGLEKPEAKEGEIWDQESDIFDTWFSSGQWPFSTLGGPEGEDFREYYPTDVMIHGRDILFWWAARMMMLSIYRTGKAPFKTVYLTGMILAPDGQKMSKSKGNGIKPSDIMDKYGVDALRLWYYLDSMPGANSPIREEKIKGNRNFINKIWNASRFVLMNVTEEEINGIKERISELEKTQETDYIKATNEDIKKVCGYIEKFKFNLGAEEIREFFWHTICDKWIEEVKQATVELPKGSSDRISKYADLLFCIKKYLIVMHPFIPYITEAVWQEFVKLGLADGLVLGQELR